MLLQAGAKTARDLQETFSAEDLQELLPPPHEDEEQEL